MKTAPQQGDRNTLEYTVRSDDTALKATIYADMQPPLPDVASTVIMIACMEKAAALVLAPHLEAHETSVGIAVEITHEAATAAGDTIRAEAILRVIEGHKYLFEVVAHDSGGVIGRGSHRRAVVKRSVIEASAKSRRTAVG